MDILEAKSAKLDRESERIDEIEESLRDKARATGRRMAQRLIKSIDPVFAPRQLSADDAKVLFHPVDYVVFKGLNKLRVITEIVFLDREAREPGRRHLQKNIERIVEAGKYDWLTVRVQNDGTMAEE